MDGGLIWVAWRERMSTPSEIHRSISVLEARCETCLTKESSSGADLRGSTANFGPRLSTCSTLGRRGMSPMTCRGWLWCRVFRGVRALRCLKVSRHRNSVVRSVRLEYSRHALFPQGGLQLLHNCTNKLFRYSLVCRCHSACKILHNLLPWPTDGAKPPNSILTSGGRRWTRRQ